jgi:hypothetical protein
MNVVARADRQDACEPGIFKTPREHQVAVEPVAAKADCREAHTHLKCDPGFLRQDDHGPATLRHLHEAAKDRNRLRRASAKMAAQRVAPAEMRLIAVCEPPPAAIALPHRFHTRRRFS